MSDITIQGPDGSFGAYLALPATTPAPGVVVAQEIFGVNQVMRDICDWLAGAGFVACCPDLFWRIEPGIQLTDKTEAEWQRAFELFNAFDVDKGVVDLQATLGHLRGHEACTGKVGDVGYCLGGKMAFLMATRTDADCSVSYYGVGLDALVGEAGNITRPLLLHIAANDRFVPPEAQEKIKTALAGNPNVTIHVYEGQDHAFARVGGEHYDEAAANLANARTLDFLKRNLAS
ncbi:MAG: dienelactone hydrolase family protein [Alphaproteobacteria bacterium]|nr:MAG: dienelactone hydrolase family protein [Alphaproteobacteria bacterium]